MDNNDLLKEIENIKARNKKVELDIFYCQLPLRTLCPNTTRLSFKIVFNPKIRLAIIISPFQKSYNDKVSFRLDTKHKAYMD